MGKKPNASDKLTQEDYDNIDCLLCHAPGYKRTVLKEGDKFRIGAAPGVDLLKAAQGVRRPTSEMCLRCHLGAGGGPNHKHGVTPTSPGSDVHVDKGLQCVDCHKTMRHKISGGSDIFAHELPEVNAGCSSCHGEGPHRSKDAAALNQHTARIACQTCHIPAAARDPAYPTIVARDWTRPVLNPGTGLYGPTNTPASNVKPVYRWWNRTMEIPRTPLGSIQDPQSKIFPWKATQYVVIADEATGKPVYIKAGVYSVTGDPGAAAKKGAEDSKQGYSGRWKGETEKILWSMNHQVAPKGQALTCAGCHAPEGALDFSALGYSGKQVKELSTVR